MPQRIGKVKIYTEEGRLIREGYVREDDIKKKNLFTASELVKGAVLIIGFIFTTGTLWTSNQDNMKTMHNDISAFSSSFDQFKADDVRFHQLIFQKFDQKDVRIDCLSQKLASCCPNNGNQC